MRYVSVFAGMGGFDLALERAGFECAGQIEIDRDATRVLEHYWPDVPRWEDVRDVGFSDESDGGRGADPQHRRNGLARTGSPTSGIDLICGGVPCQPFSVAGRRQGEADERNLWPDFLRLVRELRPRWVVAENVPGILSIDDGRFFGTILDGLGECGFAGVAYAVLDSQHFGVPQRRRRVFVVAGPTRRCAEQVLSLCESCGGHPQTRREKGQDVANTLGGGSANSRRGYRNDLDNDTYIPSIIAPTIDTHLGDKQWLEDQSVENFLPVMDAIAVRTAQTSSNGWGVNEDMAYTLDGANGQAIAHTLRAEGHDASGGGTGRGTPLIIHGTDKTQKIVSETEIAGSIRTKAPGSQENSSTTAVLERASVRRLTPTECLRLQAFPDDWLDLTPPLSDSAKYRLCGNAVTVSVVQWIAERIAALEDQT